MLIWPKSQKNTKTQKFVITYENGILYYKATKSIAKIEVSLLQNYTRLIKMFQSC